MAMANYFPNDRLEEEFEDEAKKKKWTDHSMEFKRSSRRKTWDLLMKLSAAKLNQDLQSLRANILPNSPFSRPFCSHNSSRCRWNLPRISRNLPAVNSPISDLCYPTQILQSSGRNNNTWAIYCKAGDLNPALTRLRLIAFISVHYVPKVIFERVLPNHNLMLTYHNHIHTITIYKTKLGRT